MAERAVRSTDGADEENTAWYATRRSTIDLPLWHFLELALSPPPSDDLLPPSEGPTVAMMPLCTGYLSDSRV